MNWKLCALLYLISLGVISVVTIPQFSPGYMDAEYYLSCGIQIASGRWFSEPFLWNYLDQPAQIPHSSHTYWMPLASILAASGMVISQQFTFLGARWIFLLISALVAPICATLAWKITRKSNISVLAGILALFPGMYLPYIGTTDTFGINMVLGGCFFLVVYELESGYFQTPIRPWFFGVLGILVGLLHFSRADGILWLLLPILILYQLLIKHHSKPLLPLRWKRIFSLVLPQIFWIGIGYLLVMGGWYYRNWAILGSIFPPGNEYNLWFTQYDDLYRFDVNQINPQNWAASGIESIISSRLQAFVTNIGTALFVQGEIFLWPLIIIGAWHYRHSVTVITGIAGWTFIFFLLTFIFPYAGGRGGFFHAGAPFQLLWFALASVGFFVFIRWGVKARGWKEYQAQAVFRYGIFGLILIVSGFFYTSRVFGIRENSESWNDSFTRYLQVQDRMTDFGIDLGDVVMVNNPPGFYLASGRPTVPIPAGDRNQTLAAAGKYRAKILLLDENNAQYLPDLFANPASDASFRYLETVSGIHLLEILSP